MNRRNFFKRAGLGIGGLLCGIPLLKAAPKAAISSASTITATTAKTGGHVALYNACVSYINKDGSHSTDWCSFDDRYEDSTIELFKIPEGAIIKDASIACMGSIDNAGALNLSNNTDSDITLQIGSYVE